MVENDSQSTRTFQDRSMLVSELIDHLTTLNTPDAEVVFTSNGVSMMIKSVVHVEKDNHVHLQ